MTETAEQGEGFVHGPIHAAARDYHEAYGLEASREEWEKMNMATRMNFAGVYGILNPREAAAAQAALESNRTAEKPLPPLGVVILAQMYLKDKQFRPDLA